MGLEGPITKFLDSLWNVGNQNASVGKMGVVEQEGETLNSLRERVLGIHSNKQNMVTATTEAASSLPLYSWNNVFSLLGYVWQSNIGIFVIFSCCQNMFS